MDAIVNDERWVTIGGKDEDGGGHHVLIKENGTIVAGFGTGKNVRNAFGEKKADTPEKANAAVKSKTSQIKSDDEVRREQHDFIDKNHEAEKSVIEKAYRDGIITKGVYEKRMGALNEQTKQRKAEVDGETGGSRAEAIRRVGELYREQDKPDFEKNPNAEKMLKEREDLIKKHGITYSDIEKGYKSSGGKADTPAKANAAVRFKESKPKERESDAKLKHEIEMDIESRMVRGSTEKDRPRFIKEKGELYKGIVEWAQRSLKDASAMKGMPEDTLQSYRDRLERAQRKFDLFNKMYPSVFKGAEKGVPEKEKQGNGVNISKATPNVVGGKFRNRTQERNEAQNKIEEVEEKNRKRMRREFRRYDKEREGQKQEESAIWKKHGEARRYGDAARRLNNLNPDKYNNLIKKVKRRGELASTEANEKGQELSSRMARSYADHEARKSEIMRTGRLERYPLIKQQNKRDKAIESAQSSLANAREKLKPIREKANTERLAKGDIIVTSPDGKTYRYKLGTSGGDSIRSKDLNREYHHIGGMKGFIDKLKKDGYTVKRDYEGLGSSGVKVTSPDGKTYNYQPSAKGSDYIRQSDLGRSYYYKGGLPALLQKLDKEGYDIAAHTRKISKPSKDVHVGKPKTNASEKEETANRFIKQTDRNQNRHTQFNNEQNKRFEKMLLGYKGSKYQKMAERVDGLGNGKYASLANRLRQEGSRAKRKWDADVNALREVLGKENDRFNTKYEADRDRYNKENERRKRKYEAVGNTLNRYRSKFRKAQDANIFVAQKRNEE